MLFLPFSKSISESEAKVHFHRAATASLYSDSEWQAQITRPIFLRILHLVCIMKLLKFPFTVYCRWVHVSQNIYSPLTTLQGLRWDALNVTHLPAHSILSFEKKRGGAVYVNIFKHAMFCWVCISHAAAAASRRIITGMHKVSAECWRFRIHYSLNCSALDKNWVWLPPMLHLKRTWTKMKWK